MNGHILDPRSLARIAGIAGTVAAAIAVLVAVTVGASVRGWLGFTFTGVPPHVGEAAAILVNNGRFVVGMAAAAWVAQLRVPGTPVGDLTRGGRIVAAISSAVDIVVLLAVLVNVALVGLAAGAYGWRIIPSLLPHGPFEVCAYCIAANLFLNARRRSVSTREWVTAGMACAGLLILAAGLETFAWLG